MEAYYEQTYLTIFADKISRILLQIIWAYPCRVCLGESTKEIAEYMNVQPFTDIRTQSPEYLATLIKTVIEQDFNFLSILFDDTQTLVTVGGMFQVVLYQPSDELLELTKLLCQAEGLFLKHKSLTAIDSCSILAFFIALTDLKYFRSSALRLGPTPSILSRAEL